MSAAPIPQGSHALAELRDLTQCRCIDTYKDRDMPDPDCNHLYREDVEAVAAALAASEARVAQLDSVTDHQQAAIATLQAVVVGLEASLAEALKDAALSRELERAAKELPPGWTISVEVEAGAGWVELHDELGNFISVDGEAFPLSDAVSDALDTAKGATS